MSCARKSTSKSIRWIEYEFLIRTDWSSVRGSSPSGSKIVSYRPATRPTQPIMVTGSFPGGWSGWGLVPTTPLSRSGEVCELMEPVLPSLPALACHGVTCTFHWLKLKYTQSLFHAVCFNVRCRLAPPLNCALSCFQFNALYMSLIFRQDGLLVFKYRIQGVPGGMDKTSGECSLCWTIPI